MPIQNKLSGTSSPEQETEVSRRSFLKGAAAAGGLSVLGHQSLAAAMETAQAPAGGKNPNIVIIICDQLKLDSISYFSRHFQDPAYGSHWVKTPHLDRLAREGTSFMESHSPDPWCCPSRSCMFTGRMAIETGVVTNGIGIDKRVPNMGQWFEQHTDYRRVYCGKWHAGGRWAYPDVSGPRKIPGFDTIPVGGSGSGEYADPQVSNSAASFIANDRGDQPYLLVASMLNPHDICYWNMAHGGIATCSENDVYRLGEHGGTATGSEKGVHNLEDQLPLLPPNFLYSFKDIEGEEPYKKFHGDIQWRYYAYDYFRLVEKSDTHIGRIMDAIRERNDDTVVIFTSDHGEGLGRHQRIVKQHPFESSLKVPFIIWSPNRIKAGVLDTEHIVSNVDIMPTVCSYAGCVPPPHQRGFNVRPIVDLQSVPVDDWRTDNYSEWNITGRLIRTRTYKYVMRYVYSGDFEKPFVRKADGVHTQFVPGHGDEYAEYPNTLLFNLIEDPWETANLVDDPRYAEIIEEHRHILRGWEAKLIPGQHFDRN